MRRYVVGISWPSPAKRAGRGHDAYMGLQNVREDGLTVRPLAMLGALGGSRVGDLVAKRSPPSVPFQGAFQMQEEKVDSSTRLVTD